MIHTCRIHVTIFRLVATKRSFMLKQTTSSFQLQVCIRSSPFSEHQALTGVIMKACKSKAIQVDIQAYSCIFWHDQAYSGIFSHNLGYPEIIQAYSDIVRTLCNHGIFIQYSRMFSTRGIFRTLSKILTGTVFHANYSVLSRYQLFTFFTS